MSRTQQEMSWLNSYQLLKPEVDNALKAVDDPTALATLVQSSTALAKAIGALQESVRYRSLLGKGLPVEPNHQHWLKKEAYALQVLSEAAAQKTALDSAKAAANAKAKAEEKQKLAALKAPDAFPTLGQAATMQPTKQIFTPPAKPVWKGWNKPTS